MWINRTMCERVYLVWIVAVGAGMVIAVEGLERKEVQIVPSEDVASTKAGSFHQGGTLAEETKDESDAGEINMILARPDVVTVYPDNYNWRFIKLDSANAPSDHTVKEEEDEEEEENKGQGKRRRPHNRRRKGRRKHRGYRRRWKNKFMRKYYKGNRTLDWEGRSRHKIPGSLRTRQGPRRMPNQHDAWMAPLSFRSLDPRHPKVRRHLVRQHNLLRSKVDPPAADMLAVKWYKTAAEQAQAWAEQCDHHDQLEHPSVRWTSSYGACGQNVYISPSKKRWSEVLHHWWAAKKQFRYGEDGNNATEVTAYTQMAWYNSHQLGCGIARCHAPGANTFFRYVCNYCPAGNDPKQLSRPYSEGPSCSLCPGSCRSMCPRRRCELCTNSCGFSDLWVNCRALDEQWHEWLCNTKTSQGVERFKNCRATCQCVNEIT